MKSIEKWGVFEISLDGPVNGNPYQVEAGAVFRLGHREIFVDGFYDGDGCYRIRFMPDAEGEWSWESQSSVQELSGKTGSFEVTSPQEGNHGPVRVKGPCDFMYADGSWFSNIGTTCYVWNHQEDELFQQTLETLREGPFNKIRYCIFPKHYRYSEIEPQHYPFPLIRKGESKWLGSNRAELQRGWEFDLETFVPEYFRRIEHAIGELQKIGIESDLILFHPYDRWGFSDMPPEAEDRYLRYVVARLAAFRNVWWSFANEWDLMGNKTENDWERYARVVQQYDPYGHLRSIHNCRRNYDHSRAWVTHVSYQGDPKNVARLRQEHGKPVVVDECRYEGDIEEGWGNISGREMTHRFWVAVHQGGFCGHGETYWNTEEILWWSKGGTLGGSSPPRIAFLRKVVESGCGGVFRPSPRNRLAVRGSEEQEFLYYGGDGQSREIRQELPEGKTYRAEVIDTWEMTIEKLPNLLSGKVTIPLPGKTGIAVRLIRES